MVRVKTFAGPLKIFHAREEIVNLDNQVNQFIEEHNITKVISVSDTCTADGDGKTIGIIRVLTYE